MINKTAIYQELKDHWSFLKSCRAGERFQRFHEHRRAACRGRRRRIRIIAWGLAVMALGIVMLPAPGPGTVVLLVGLALVAQASRTVARGCDAVEMRLRALASRLMGRSQSESSERRHPQKNIRRRRRAAVRSAR
jgi:hypothetical protein